MNANHTNHANHAVPLSTLLAVFAGLLALTGATVAATWIDLGSYNVFLALGIAVVKAALVALFFMHLRWDSPFNGVIFIVAMLFVALFMSLALIDSSQYYHDIRTFEAASPAAAK